LVALAAKTYRVYTIFNAKMLRHVRFGLQRVLALVGIGVLAVLILILAWNLTAPLQWTRVIEFEVRGSPTNSTGFCAAETTASMAFVLLITLMYLMSLVMTAILAYKVRDVPSDYQESKYVALILLSLVQVYVVAIPSTVAVYSVVIGRFLLMSTVVFLTVVVILGLMFVPKIFRLEQINASNSSNKPPVKPRSQTTKNDVQKKFRMPVAASKEDRSINDPLYGTLHLSGKLVPHGTEAFQPRSLDMDSSFVVHANEQNGNNSGGHGSGNDGSGGPPTTTDASGKDKSRTELTVT